VERVATAHIGHIRPLANVGFPVSEPAGVLLGFAAAGLPSNRRSQISGTRGSANIAGSTTTTCAYATPI
jgi:hypothetical protein